MRTRSLPGVVTDGMPPTIKRLFVDIINNKNINTGPLQKALVISSGAITIPPDHSNLTVDGSGASTNLTTINGGVDGDLVFFRIAANARAVVFKHTGGNIICNGGADLTVSSVNYMVVGFYDGTLAVWKCVLFNCG